MVGFLEDNKIVKMEYKVTTLSQAKALSGLFLGTVIMLIAVYFVIQADGYSDGIPIIFGTGYLIILIPTLFLHIEYYLKNRNDILIIDTSEKTISINEQKSIFFNQIESIIYVMPPVWHRKGIIRLLPFEDYHYAKIKMKNGEEFIFTCLMAYRVEDVLEQISGIAIEKRKMLFATMLIG